MHGDSVGFFCGKKPSPCGLVFLTAEKTLCMAVRGIFPREKTLTLWTGVFDSGKNVVHGGEGEFSAGKKQVLAGGAVFLSSKIHVYLCVAVVVRSRHAATH